jgi:hypothetical protein
MGTADALARLARGSGVVKLQLRVQTAAYDKSAKAFWRVWRGQRKSNANSSWRGDGNLLGRNGAACRDRLRERPSQRNLIWPTLATEGKITAQWRRGYTVAVGTQAEMREFRDVECTPYCLVDTM